MNRKEQKIYEIVHHPDFTRSRTLTSILKSIEVGISLEDEKRLFIIVHEVFKYGKPRGKAYIQHAFKKDMKFLKREFKGIRT